MKKIAITALTLLIGLSVQAQEPNFRVHGRISYPCKLMYLYIKTQNQMSVDSCNVSSQGDYELTATLEEKREYSADIIPFPFIPQKGFSLSVMAGEDILLNIDSNTFFIPDVEGSPLTQEDLKTTQRKNAAFQRNRYLKEKIAQAMLDESEMSAYRDSLAQNEYYLNTQRWLETADETISPNNHRIALTLLSQVGDVSKETMDSLIAVMKNKFPNDELIQLYPDFKPAAPPTYESFLARVHRNKLLGLPAPTPWDKEKRKKTSYDLTALQVGDMIDTLSVESLGGDRIHLKDIKTDYVLLEFWAGWCAPCIKEIPHLLEVQRKFGDELTILAISFDMDRTEWKKAIEKNGNGSFMHGYIGNDTQQTDLFMQRFGIKGIPASFLLDKDRRIVGANFRGKALEQMMEELTDGISGE